MTDENFTKLRQLIDAAAPIDWVSTPDRDKPDDWAIHFNVTATFAQQQVVRSIITNFVPDAPKPLITLKDLSDKLDQALADIAGIKDGTIKLPK